MHRVAERRWTSNPACCCPLPLCDLAGAESGMPPRPEKRRQMLDAAFELLLRDGPAGLSMDALANAAEVSKPTIYAHFGSKSDLCTAMIEECGERIRTAVDPVVSTVRGDDVRGELLVLARECLAALAHPRCVALFRMLVVEGPRNRALREVVDSSVVGPLHEQIEHAFERLTSGGGLAGATPREMRTLFLGMLDGVWMCPVLVGLKPPLTEDEVAANGALIADSMLNAFGPGVPGDRLTPSGG